LGIIEYGIRSAIGPRGAAEEEEKRRRGDGGGRETRTSLAVFAGVDVLFLLVRPVTAAT